MFHQASCMSFPIRSASVTVGGLYVFARILDKIRLDDKGELPEGYHVGLIPGSRTFDDRVCRFLGVSFDDLRARTLAGGTDEEILEWCFNHGKRPDEEQLEIWNTFMQKRGWNDSASAGLEKQKIAAGLGDRSEIQTFFSLFDHEEGRK
jgi:gluconokinase